MRAKFINETLFTSKKVKEELKGLPNFLKNLEKAGIHTYRLSDYDQGSFSCSAQILEDRAHDGSRIFHIHYVYDAEKVQKFNEGSKRIWENGIKVGIYSYGERDEPLYKGPLEDWDGAFLAIIEKLYGDEISKIEDRIEDTKNSIIDLEERLREVKSLEKELEYVKTIIQNES